MSLRRVGTAAGGTAPVRRLAASLGGREFRALLLVAVCVVVYAPVFDAGYLHDDDVMVSENPLVQQGGPGFGRDAWSGLAALWLPAEPTQHHMPGIPVTASVLWLGWRLFGGDDPAAAAAGYHVMNVLLHALCALLLFRLLTAMGVPGAWWAALVWGVHPVAVESVAWIAETKNTLSMLFSLLCVGAWWQWLTRGRSADWARALLFFALAAASKPAVVPLPVVLLCVAWWRRSALVPRELRAALPFAAVAIVVGLVGLHFQETLSLDDEALATDDPFARAAHASFAFGFYVWKLLFPVYLLPVYPAWQEVFPRWLQVAPALLAALACAAAWRRRDTWGRHLLLSAGVFASLLVPALGFVEISSMRLAWVADRFQYHAMAAPIALLVATAATLATTRRRRALLASAAFALVTALVGKTVVYAEAFHDAATLRAYTLARNPDVWRWQNHEGFLAFREGRLQDALRYLSAAARARPDRFEVHTNLGSVLGRLGRTERALHHYRLALALRDDDPLLYQSYGNVLLAAGRPAEAVDAYEASLALDPEHALTLTFYGTALFRVGRREAAVDAYRRALAADPQLEAPRLNLESARARRSLEGER